jgi:hypothetical protein
MDRPELQFSAKEVARFMANPTERGWEMLKRLVRFLISHPRMVQRFEKQPPRSFAEAKFPRQWGDSLGDSDWAGCPITRKSTSCVMLMLGAHLIRSSVTTQAVNSLSTGEAEFHTLVKAASMAIGFQAMAADLGVDLRMRIWTDSNAAKGIASRRGVGKVRHLAVKILWIQQALQDNVFDLCKADGKEHVPDLGTKYVETAQMWKLLGKLSFYTAVGRSGLALKATS